MVMTPIGCADPQRLAQVLGAVDPDGDEFHVAG
jgi:hypothetical protein